MLRKFTFKNWNGCDKFISCRHPKELSQPHFTQLSLATVRMISQNEAWQVKFFIGCCPQPMLATSLLLDTPWMHNLRTSESL